MVSNQPTAVKKLALFFDTCGVSDGVQRTAWKCWKNRLRGDTKKRVIEKRRMIF